MSANMDQVTAMIAAGNMAGAMALLSSPQPVMPQVSQVQQPHPNSLESRVTVLEQLVQRVAAPVMDEAAQVGMSIMGALGKAMTQDQASWVQSKLNTSPEFFASQNCKDAIDIFISEWKSYEGNKRK
jgi:hypothetical protein